MNADAVQAAVADEAARHYVATVDRGDICCTCGAVVPYGEHAAHLLTAAVAAAEPVIRAQIAAEVRRRCIDKGHAIHFETRATALCPDCSDLAAHIARGQP